MPTTLSFLCDHCGNKFSRSLKNCRNDRNRHNFCNRDCSFAFLSKSETHPCKWCSTPVTRQRSELRKTKSIFCNSACAASYNNTQRRKSRRSKCEQLLCDLIRSYYPELKVDHSDKSMLDGYEVDIAIPELNLGIEWNGIVHFKPIYGESKLKSISDRDRQKEDIARKKGINLIVVPDLVSTETYVRETFYKIKPFIDELKVGGRSRTP